MSDPIDPQTPKDVVIDDKHLKKMFLEHLNGIYYGKKHLLDFFAEAMNIASLKHLKLAINECIDDTIKQIESMDEIYASIDQKPSKTSILGVKGMTLEAYMTVIKAGKTPVERDVFILFYLQIIEGIEITYFKVLKNLAKAVGHNHTFLDEPFDLAVDNRLMFETIYKEYIN